MDIYTMDGAYRKKEEIEGYESVIWTDRYSGEGDVQLKCEADPNLLAKLLPGTLLGQSNSPAPMILETHEVDAGECTIGGISLPRWLDNRFIRHAPQPSQKTYDVTNITPDALIRNIVAFWATSEGAASYLNDSYHSGDVYPSPPSMGVPNASRLIIPSLSAENHTHMSLAPIDYSVPYGPIYTVIKSLADTYGLGLRIYRIENGDHTYRLVFSVYSGLNRTSTQTTNSVVRFSEKLESLTNVKELSSNENYKNLIFGWAPQVDELWSEVAGPGIQDFSDGASGFDLRADMIWSDSITQTQIDGITWPAVGGPAPVYLTLMNHEIAVYAQQHRQKKLADGEVPPDISIKFGVDYDLGDVVEIQGNSGVITPAVITEYIQSQDSTGFKEYPTVSIVE